MSSSTTTTTTNTITLQRPKYPVGIPTKFSSDGVVQKFPGNTTLCHVPANSPLLPGLRKVYSTLASHPILSNQIHLLPQASWHMTVVDGVREIECEPGMWPPGKEKQPLVECTEEFSEKLRLIGPQLVQEGLAAPYHMRVRKFDPAIVGIGLEVEGATADEEKRMRKLRDKLADTFGFRAPNHKTYGFHISMAYLMRHIDGEERKLLNEVFTQHLPDVQIEFDLNEVEFCTFENMYSFKRLFYLGENADDS